ncbi:transglutaminase-like cysteine peptidase [Chelativorans sp. M5D2P16]|uniref:transglutaminase-like cysteine peptidase n=1 Tax=Chelativorans sp. M5D2P16 TaxID=3095678 RepID=UPI002ACA5F2B|nr:transglutaminase-like cysteine peptidase [Chelativorans sp. M5D2P16]MDZ5697656.1 transglutaminase-like cysteine peptidase [Chelativorans sp. M5D2P16]
MQKTKPAGLLSAGALLLAAMSVGSAHAASDFMAIGDRTSQPVGHYEFCQRKPDECGPTASEEKMVPLTRELWAKMVEVNNAVNTTVIPRTDTESWGIEEYWSFPDLYGDCEDFVLEKRRLLMAAGVPASNLLITVVRQPNGDGHAVLTVSTNMGDFILDNLEPRILAWSETEYQYLKRQSARHAGEWTAVNDGRAVAVASVGSER